MLGEISYLQEDKEIPITVRTPARIQAVVRLWWRYGPMLEERRDSWLYVRIVAFARTAAFAEESAILSVGDPIAGVIEASSGDHDTAQLSGWHPFRLMSGSCAPPRTFPDEGFELNGDSIAALPALAKDNFAHFKLPHVPFDRLYGFWEPKYLDPFSKAPLLAGRRSRSADRDMARPSSPRNSPERRLRERYYAKVAQKKADNLDAAAKCARAPAPAPPSFEAPPNFFVPISLGVFAFEVVTFEFRPTHEWVGFDRYFGNIHIRG